MAAVKNSPFALQLVSPSLREDPLVVNAAVSRNGSVISLSPPPPFSCSRPVSVCGSPHPESALVNYLNRSIDLSIWEHAWQHTQREQAWQHTQREQA